MFRARPDDCGKAALNRLAMVCSSRMMKSKKISTVTIVPTKAPREPRMARTKVSMLLGEAKTSTQLESEKMVSRPYRSDCAY